MSTSKDTINLLTEGLLELVLPEGPLKDRLKNSRAQSKILGRPGLVLADLVVPSRDLDQLVNIDLTEYGYDNSEDCFVSVLGIPITNKHSLISADRLNELTTLRNFNLREEEKSTRCFAVSYDIAFTTELQKDLHSIEIGVRNIRSFLSEEQRLLFSIAPEIQKPYSASNFLFFVEALREIMTRSSGPPLAVNISAKGQTIETVASMISIIADNCLHLKFSDGFDLPIAVSDDSLGFLNGIVALYLARSYVREEFTETHIKRVLNETNLAALRIGDSLGWGDFSISIEKLRELNEEFHLSIQVSDLVRVDEELTKHYGKPL